VYVVTGEPFTRADAKRHALRLLDEHAIRFSGHAQTEMVNDGIIEAEVLNTIRHGVAFAAVMQPSGHYSYKFTRRDVGVAMAFRFDGETLALVVVRTAWRIKRRTR